MEHFRNKNQFKPIFAELDKLPVRDYSGYLNSLTGTLSKPGKMPCYGYSLPAQECKIGAKLVGIKGSTCNKCYALRGNYRYSTPQNAMYFRFKSISNPLWVPAMVLQIKLNNSGDTRFFRWHDSGDIQSVDHLDKIVQIAKLLSGTKFWLPTREYKIVADYPGKIPPNLIIRFSAHMIDSTKEVENKELKSVVFSQEKLGELPTDTYICPVTTSKVKKTCGTCRACWDKKIKTIAYKKH